MVCSRPLRSPVSNSSVWADEWKSFVANLDSELPVHCTSDIHLKVLSVGRLSYGKGTESNSSNILLFYYVMDSGGLVPAREPEHRATVLTNVKQNKHKTLFKAKVTCCQPDQAEFSRYPRKSLLCCELVYSIDL